MSEVARKARLYSAIFATAVKFRCIQLYRNITRTKHPKGWPPEQEWPVMLMKAVFKIGTYTDWRKLIDVLAASKVPELDITPVPASTFKAPGWRDSYWVDLKPELQPQNPKSSLVMMYLHGGGFTAGAPLMYKPAYLYWMQQLAALGVHMRVCAVGYPLAPEQQFPAGITAVAEAYDWLVKQLGGSDSIVVAGDSAGGNLTITSLIYMRERATGFANIKTAAAAPPAAAAAAAEPYHPPQAAVLISPAVDFTSAGVFSRPSHDPVFKFDYITPGEISSVNSLYIPSGVPMDDPLITPLHAADFTRLVKSKLLVMTGGCESLAPDIIRFVDHVRKVSPDVDIAHHIEENEPHCYATLKAPWLLAKGAKVLTPFLEEAAATTTAKAVVVN